jgi:hypothetical protein
MVEEVDPCACIWVLLSRQLAGDRRCTMFYWCAARILAFLFAVSVPVWRAIRNFGMGLDSSKTIACYTSNYINL